MNNQREKKLWYEIGWLRFLLAILATFILGVIYLTIWEWIPSFWRDLLLSVVGNIIPIPLIFVFAYIAFRRIEELRLEKDADELANRVVLKFFQVLEHIQTNNTSTANDPLSLLEQDFHVSTDMKLDLELEVHVQPFDPKSQPQKLVIECNFRGSNPIYIKKITYSGSNLKAREHLNNIYKLDGFDAIILEEQVKVSSGTPYTFDLILAGTKKWKKTEIESWYKNLGFLHFEIEYNGQLVKDTQKKI